MCLDMLSRLALASEDQTQAQRYAERALASARSERSGDPADDRYRIAAAYRHLGDVRQRSGDASGAKAAWAAGVAQLPEVAAETPLEMDIRAGLLRRVGRGEDARPIASRLAEIGYKAET
jgi:hypothetical protein